MTKRMWVICTSIPAFAVTVRAGGLRNVARENTCHGNGVSISRDWRVVTMSGKYVIIPKFTQTLLNSFMVAEWTSQICLLSSILIWSVSCEVHRRRSQAITGSVQWTHHIFYLVISKNSQQISLSVEETLKYAKLLSYF